jgi:leader peptidase (prepilin peptidase)/N-methyltransferase
VALLLLAIVGLLGLAVGSFLNVVIWRVPRGESVVHPPSGCPQCGHAIRPVDNVPVASWLLLRGRCRDCGEPISRRYPAVEAATAVVFVLTTLVIGVSWALPAFLYLASIAVCLTLIDIDTHRLPDAIVLPSYGVGAFLLALASLNPGGDSDWSALVRAAVGCAALYVFYFVAWFIYPKGMGFGDVKLAGVLGMHLGWLGWGTLAVGAFAAFLVAGLYAVVLLVTRRATRKTGIPFGPWMLLGAAIGMVWGEPVWAAYLDAMV